MSQPQPTARVSLFRCGLAHDYDRYDDDDCASHVIGYRFVAWMDKDSVAVGFNTSPACRAVVGHPVVQGNQRLLVFDSGGHLIARRELGCSADGGEEIVADGVAALGPGQTLLIRIEEAQDSKSGVLLLDSDLKDVIPIDRLMETKSVIDHSLVFQQGFVLVGPRTYDIYDGSSRGTMQTITQDVPTDTLDRRVGKNGGAYAACEQEPRHNEYIQSNIIFSGAHRRCTLHVVHSVGAPWESKLKQDDVVEIAGILDASHVIGIVRGRNHPDSLVRLHSAGRTRVLPWFPFGYDSSLQSVADTMYRYQGYGVKLKGSSADGRLMIFDDASQSALVDRSLSESSRAAIAPNGLLYAIFESGELLIYALPASSLSTL